MFALISIGLLSGLFFSSTFILNRVMSLEGGHWVWSASLRYAFMIILLLAFTSLLCGLRRTFDILQLYCRNWSFWTIAGSIGFGGFYSLLCFSADHAPGWVIAATWQLTIIASLFVLMGFGRRFPKKVWAFSSIVFVGVLLINLSHVAAVNFEGLLLGALPVLAAAFCYPVGNQLVWEAKNGSRSLPDISDPLLENPFNKILLLSLGSLPFWIILVAVNAPPAPTTSQVLNTALVAVLSGLMATSLFLLARNRSEKPSELAAVDATQSSEVVFALAGEILFLGLPFPGASAIFGIVLVFLGLILFIFFQEVGASQKQHDELNN